MANKPLKTIKFPGLADTYTVPQIDATLAVSGKAADAKATGDAIADVVEDVTALQAELPDLTETVMSAFATDTASGAIATFPDGADNVPVKALTVDIESVQSGSGDPSPSNVRPITGWTQAKVTRTGVNVWDEEWELGNIDTSGNNSPASDRFRSKNYIAVVPDTTYKIVAPSTLNLRFYDKNKTLIDYYSASSSFTTASNCYYVRFVCVQTTYNHDISINYPSTDTSYHSGANNETYTIDLDGTRYGGTLDVTSGVLTVTHGIYTFTGNEIQYIQQTGNVAVNMGTVTAKSAPCVCSDFASVQTGSTRYAYIQTSMTAEELKTYMGSHTVQLCYELATPLTVQLTAKEVTTLLGTNNIFADCGDVEVEYRADTKLYIDKLLNA